MHRLERKTLITGVSGGIGGAIARGLLDDGHQVIGVSRNAGGLDPGAGFTGYDIDLQDLSRLEQKTRTLIAEHPDIDSAVFCAGAGRFGSLEEFSARQIQSLIDLNFTSQAVIAASIIASMKRRKFGDLIFLGSEAALRGSRRGSIYCASKFAIRGFTQALRDECARSNVRVSLINPGMVRSGFFDQLDFTHGDSASNAIEPDDIADLVSLILQGRRGTIVDEITLNPANRVIRHRT